jgi:hypothetical protein
MAIITLKGNYKVLVDEDDFDVLKKWSWHYHPEGYATRGTEINGKKINIYMHRQIVNAPKGFHVHHKNRNRLDNRKENLQILTAIEHWKMPKMGKDGKIKEKKKITCPHCHNEF